MSLSPGKLGRREIRGLSMVALGVIGFSFTFPATRMALGATPGQSGGFDPLVVGFGRTALAVPLGLLSIWLSPFRINDSRIPRHLMRPLLLVAMGNGLGFGALTAIALKTSTASHGAIVIAGLPIATAIISVIRNRERPSPSFWLASVGGTAVVLIVTIAHSSGGVTAADLILLAAVGIGGMGYAEGGRLAKEIPGTLVISWSLVLAAPIAAIVAATALATTSNAPDATAWLGLSYLALVSMFLGFLPFYRGLADVGVTKASQIQLIQPLLTIFWSGLLLKEIIGLDTVMAAVIVLAFVVATQVTRVHARTPAAR